MQYATYLTLHATCNMYHTTCNMQQVTQLALDDCLRFRNVLGPSVVCDARLAAERFVHVVDKLTTVVRAQLPHRAVLGLVPADVLLEVQNGVPLHLERDQRYPPRCPVRHV